MIEGRGEQNIDRLRPIGMGVAIALVECIAVNRGDEGAKETCLKASIQHRAHITASIACRGLV